MSLAWTVAVKSKPPQFEEAVRYYTAAIALRPDSAGLRTNLGLALKDQTKLDEAIAQFREAIRLKPDDSHAHNNLGIALKEQGKLDQAMAEFREASAGP